MPVQRVLKPYGAMVTLIFACCHLWGEEVKTGGANGLPADPQGEWYEVGYKMAIEAAPVFHQFGRQDAEISQRLDLMMEILGTDVSSVKTSDKQMLQRGWDDALAGRTLAMTYPEDQKISLVPAPLSGFHKFAESNLDIDELAKGVVLIKTSDGLGTGFFVALGGWILTNRHVVGKAERVSVQVEDGEMISGEVRLVAESCDLAIVKIAETDHHVLPLGDSDRVRRGNKIIVIGYPGFGQFVGKEATATFGSISSTDRTFPDIDGNNALTSCFQLDATTNPGNSGGPVLSADDGSVIGIHTYGLASLGVDRGNFSIKIKEAFQLLRDLNVPVALPE